MFIVSQAGHILNGKITERPQTRNYVARALQVFIRTTPPFVSATGVNAVPSRQPLHTISPFTDGQNPHGQ